VVKTHHKQNVPVKVRISAMDVISMTMARWRLS